MSFSSGQLRPSRRLSMRARRAEVVDDLAAERDMLMEAVRRERGERTAVSQEVLSLQNAVRNSKKAVDVAERRIRALVKELDDVYDECPRLEARLPEIKDGFLYKEMALSSAIRLWVDQTGGIGIDMKAEGKEEMEPVVMQNISPYSRGLE